MKIGTDLGRAIFSDERDPGKIGPFECLAVLIIVVRTLIVPIIGRV